ncbi:MAG: TetR/AcrR family transcriptional regulator [Methanosphaera stadtmanae]|nr:TetR/AcrR family transcriptional regulator [Methanosphaera stadtmanae]
MSTYDKIMETTYKLCTEKGFNNVSLSDICKKSGIGSGTLYYYFKSKDELMESVLIKFILEKFYLNYQKTQHKTKNTRDQLETLYKELLGLNKNYKPHVYDRVTNQETYKQVLSLLSEGIQNNHAMKEEYIKYNNMYTEMIKKILLEGIEKREVRSDLNLDDSLIIIKTSIHGLYFMIMSNEDYNLEKLVKTNFEYVWNSLKP